MEPSDQVATASKHLGQRFDDDDTHTAPLSMRLSEGIETLVASYHTIVDPVAKLITPVVMPSDATAAATGYDGFVGKSKTAARYMPTPPSQMVTPCSVTLPKTRFLRRPLNSTAGVAGDPDLEGEMQQQQQGAASPRPGEEPADTALQPPTVHTIVSGSSSPTPGWSTPIERIGSLFSLSAGIISPARMSARASGKVVTYEYPSFAPPSVVQPVACLPLDLFCIDDERFPLSRIIYRAQKGEHIPALSRYRHPDDTVTWEPCTIVDGDFHTERLIIEWQRGATKTVSRLNVVLRYLETTDVAEERMRQAQEARRDFERAFRAQLWLESLPTDAERPLPKDQLARILSKTRLKHLEPVDETHLSDELEAVQDEYLRASRLAVCTYNCLDPSVAQTMSALQIEAPAQPSSLFPRCGVTIPGYSRETFLQQRQVIATSHYMLVPQLQRALLDINRAWYKALPSIDLVALNFDTSPGTPTKPFKERFSMNFHDFLDLQQATLREGRSRLLLLWVSAIDSTLTVHATECFPSSYLDDAQYKRSHLHRFLRTVNLMMSARLRELTALSLRSYANYFSTFRLPTPIAVSRQYTVPLESPSVPKGRVLLRVQVQFDTANLQAKLFPNVLDIEGDLLGVLSAVVTCGSNFEHIEKSFLLCVEVEPQLLACWDQTDPIVAECRSAVSKSTARDIKAIQQLLAAYQKYSFLLEPELDPTAEVLLNPDDPNDVSILEAALPSLRKSFEDIEKLSPADVPIGVFLVECEHAKTTLLDACTRRFHATVNAVAAIIRETCARVCAAFEELFRFIQSRPSTPEAWMQAKNFVEKRKAELDAVREEEFRTMILYQETLDKYGNSTPLDVRELVFQMHQWPAIIEVCMHRNEAMWEREKNEFVVVLEAHRADIVRDVERMGEELALFSKEDDYDHVDELAHKARALNKNLQKSIDAAELLNSRERLFDLPSSGFPVLEDAVRFFHPFLVTWTTAAAWVSSYPGYLDGPFISLDAEEIASNTEQWRRELRSVSFPLRAYPAALKLCLRIQTEIANFQEFVPLIEMMRSRALRPVHWKEISRLLGLELSPSDPSFTVSTLLSLNIKQHEAEIEALTSRAEQESDIESQLDRMKSELKSVRLRIITGKGIAPSLADPSDSTNVLDRQLTVTQQLRRNPYVAPFASQCRDWEHDVTLALETMTLWNDLQRQYLLLVPLLSMATDQDRLELKEVFRTFTFVDTRWKETMFDAERHIPTLYALLSHLDIVTNFREVRNHLSKLQVDVSNLLDFKRNVFPRLYFVTDEEFLQIIGAVGDPMSVQSCFPRLFSQLHRVEMEDGCIVAIASHEGVRLVLSHAVEAVHAEVPTWLRSLDATIRETLRSALNTAIYEYCHQPRRMWMFKWTGHLVNLVHKLMITREIEELIPLAGRRGLQAYLKKLSRQEHDIIELVTLSSKLRAKDRSILSVVLLNEKYHRDHVEHLITNNVTRITDLEYEGTIRYYLLPDGNVEVRTMGVANKYGFEFVSSVMPYCHTPSNIPVIRSLLCTLGSNGNQCAALYGNHYVGKSHLAREVAEMCGRHLITFSCHEHIDAIALRRCAKGAVMTGAWLLLDEAENLKQDVISQLVQVVTGVLSRARLGISDPEIPDIGDSTPLIIDQSFAIIATSSTTSLPHSITTTFRPIALRQADGACIFQSVLFSLGFLHSQEIGLKLWRVLQVISHLEPCIVPLHVFKPVVLTLKVVVFRDQVLHMPQTERTVAVEDRLVLTALHRVLKHRIVTKELWGHVVEPAFGTDLDEGVSWDAPVDPVDLKQLEKYFPEAYVSATLVLFERLVIAQTVAVTGPMVTGKTLAWREAHKLTHSSAEPIVCCLHSFSVEDMHGYWDVARGAERQWHPGVLDRVATQVEEALTLDQPVMLCFDGDLTQNVCVLLGSLVSEGRRLECSSGKVVELPNIASIVFECPTTSFTTPSFLSRVGIVHTYPVLTPAQIAVHELQNNKQLRDSMAHNRLCQIMSTIITPCCRLMENEHGRDVTVWAVLGVVRLLQALAEARAENERFPDAERANNYGDIPLVFSMYVAMGSFFKEDHQCAVFMDALREGVRGCAELSLEFPLPTDLVPDDLRERLPGEAGWTHWTECRDSPIDFYPNNAIGGLAAITSQLMNAGVSVMVFGPSCCRKTKMMRSVRAAMCEDGNGGLWLDGTSNLSTASVLSLVMPHMSKRSSRMWGPSSSSRFGVFIDDVHLTRKSGSASTGGDDISQATSHHLLEWVRWHLSHGSYFDMRHGRTTLQGVGYALAAQQSFVLECPRELRNLIPIGMPAAPLTEVDDVVLRYLSEWATESQAKVLATVCATIHREVIAKFVHTPLAPHYHFSAHHLMQLAANIKAHSSDILVSCATLRDVVCYESHRLYSDGASIREDREWLTSLLEAVTELNLTAGMPARRNSSSLPAAARAAYLTTTAMSLDIRREIELTPVPAERIVDRLNRTVSEYWESVLVAEADMPKTVMVSASYPLTVTTETAHIVAAVTELIARPRGQHILLHGDDAQQALNLVRFSVQIMKSKLRVLDSSVLASPMVWLAELRKIHSTLMRSHEGKRLVLFVSHDTFGSNDCWRGELEALLRGNILGRCYTQEELGQLLENVSGTSGDKMEAVRQRIQSQLRVVYHVGDGGLADPNLTACHPALLAAPCVVCPRISRAHVTKVAEAVFEPIPRASLPLCARETALVASTIAGVYFHKLTRERETEARAITFITVLKKLVLQRYQNLTDRQQTYRSALDRLIDLQNQHSSHLDEVNRLTPEARQLDTSITAFQNHVTSELKRLEKLKKEFAETEAECLRLATEIEQHKGDITHAMEANVPAMKSAREKMEKVTEGEVQYLRSYTTVPPPIKRVFEALCHLLGERFEVNSRSAGGDVISITKRVMDDKNFVERMVSQQEECLDPQNMKRVHEIVTSSNFIVSKLYHINHAVGVLASYLVALNNFHNMLGVVGPLQMNVSDKESKLELLVHRFEELREHTQSREKSVNVAVKQLEEIKLQRNILVETLEASERQVRVIAEISAAVNTSEPKWKEMLSTTGRAIETLFGDMVGIASLICRHASEGIETRPGEMAALHEELSAHAVSVSEPFDAHEVMGIGQESRIHAIFNSFTSTEAFFCTNYATMLASPLPVCLIDSYGVGVNFLTRRFGPQAIHAFNSWTPDPAAELQFCMKEGLIAVITLHDDLPLALKKFVRRIARFAVFGGSVLPYNTHKSFRCFFRVEDADVIKKFDEATSTFLCVINFLLKENVSTAVNLSLLSHAQGRTLTQYNDVMNTAVQQLTRQVAVSKSRDDLLKRVASFSEADNDTAARDLITDIALTEKMEKKWDRSMIALEELREQRDANWKKVSTMISSLFLAAETFSHRTHPSVPFSLTNLMSVLDGVFQLKSPQAIAKIGRRTVDDIHFDDLRQLISLNFMHAFFSVASASMDHFERVAFLLHCFTQCRKEITAACVAMPDLMSSDVEAQVLVAPAGALTANMPKSARVIRLPCPPQVYSVWWDEFLRLCGTVRSLEGLPELIAKDIAHWTPFLLASGSSNESVMVDPPESATGRVTPMQMLLMARCMSFHLGTHVIHFLKLCMKDVMDFPTPPKNTLNTYQLLPRAPYVILPRPGINPWLELCYLGKRTRNLPVIITLNDHDTMAELASKLQRLSTESLPPAYTGIFVFISVPEVTPSWVRRVHVLLDAVASVGNAADTVTVWVAFRQRDVDAVPKSILARCRAVRFSRLRQFDDDLSRLNSRVEDSQIISSVPSEDTLELARALKKLAAFHAALLNTECFGRWRQHYDAYLSDNDFELACGLVRKAVAGRSENSITPYALVSAIVYGPRCLSAFDATRRMSLASDVFHGSIELASSAIDVTTHTTTPSAPFRRQFELERRNAILTLLTGEAVGEYVGFTGSIVVQLKKPQSESILFESDTEEAESPKKSLASMMLHYQATPLRRSHPFWSWTPCSRTLVPLASLESPIAFIDFVVFEFAKRTNVLSHDVYLDAVALDTIPTNMTDGVVVSGAYSVGVQLGANGSVSNVSETKDTPAAPSQTLLKSIPVLWLKPTLRASAVARVLDTVGAMPSSMYDMPLVVCDHIPSGVLQDMADGFDVVATVQSTTIETSEWFKNAHMIILPKNNPHQ